MTIPKLRAVTKKTLPLAKALPLGSDLFTRPIYVPGDGEQIRAMRLGASDHLLYKSKTGSK